jgi:hypothetical protein
VFDLELQGRSNLLLQTMHVGMYEIRREAWGLNKYGDWSQGVHLTVKEKVAKRMQ